MRWKRCCGAPPMATATADGRGRLGGRAQVVLRALFSRLASGGRRARPVDPQRILIAHHLLLGDTLMLTPLVAKLRERHPAADLVMAVPEAYAPLYARAPYGLRAIGWDPRRPSLSPLWRERGFRSRVHSGRQPHELARPGAGRALDRRFCRRSSAEQELAGRRAVGVSEPSCRLGRHGSRLDRRPAPGRLSPRGLAGAARQCHRARARAALRGATRWRQHATQAMGRRALGNAGAALVGARASNRCGPRRASEAAIVHACDPQARHRSFAGALSLPQIWQLIAGAALLVSPDTGIAHLGRIVGTPTVALFGPGSVTLTGAGAFWREVPYRAVTVDPFPCRDQRTLFKREIAWVRRCERSPAECPHPRCMDAIGVEAVAAAIAALGIDLG